MKLFKYFTKSREQEKQVAINGILNSLFNNHLEFTHSEQTEILNRVIINAMERKKETRTNLLKDLRDLQDSIKEIKLN